MPAGPSCTRRAVGLDRTQTQHCRSAHRHPLRRSAQVFDALLSLILGTAEITGPAHVNRLDDGERKCEEATTALDSLRAQVLPYRRMRSEAEAAEVRREHDRETSRAQQGVALKLNELREQFMMLHQEEPQERGY